jgi:hypothetical protein
MVWRSRRTRGPAKTFRSAIVPSIYKINKLGFVIVNTLTLHLFFHFYQLRVGGAMSRLSQTGTKG